MYLAHPLKVSLASRLVVFKAYDDSGSPLNLIPLDRTPNLSIRVFENVCRLVVFQGGGCAAQPRDSR